VVDAYSEFINVFYTTLTWEQLQQIAALPDVDSINERMSACPSQGSSAP
jgi:hypothetical protein